MRVQVGEPGGGSGVCVPDVCASPGAAHIRHRWLQVSEGTEGLLLAPPGRIANEDKAFKDTVLVLEVDRQLNINDHIPPCRACLSQILP